MLLIYSHTVSSRLQYICNFIFAEYYNIPFSITTSIEEYKNRDGAKINYSAESIHGSFAIQPRNILFEAGIKEQQIECFAFNEHKVFFKTSGDYPFDIFAAAFYLLSRYEEYLPHKKDMYGRYDHENSIAFREGFLQWPLVNIWLNDFAIVLKDKFPFLNIHHPSFKIIPTYDIDIAWSYKNKSFVRHAGSFVKSLFTLNFSYLKERLSVLAGKQKDPYDAYQWMDELHERYRLEPIYFFLVAEKNYGYDKNISPSREGMNALIRQHAKKYSIGIHPSWQSGDDDNILRKEINTLKTITGNPVAISRQHYIRFNLPQGYQRLIAAGITDDHSMGYGGINGFRASIANSFYWYDLEKENQTNLRIHPFCYMEANSFYEQKYTTAQAFDEMMHYYSICKKVGGTYILLWHNHILGSNKMFEGWSEIYEQFFRHIDGDKNWEDAVDD